MVDDLVILDRCVDHREFFQPFDSGFREERHEAETHTVVLFEGILVATAQRHDLCQVHFVEGRQHRSRVLRVHHALGNARAQTGHGHTLLFALESDDRLFVFHRGWSMVAWRYLTALLTLQEAHYVRLGDTAVLAAAGHHRRIEIMLLQETAHGRAGFPRFRGTLFVGRRFCLRDRLFGLRRGFPALLRFGGRCGTLALCEHGQ